LRKRENANEYINEHDDEGTGEEVGQ